MLEDCRVCMGVEGLCVLEACWCVWVWKACRVCGRQRTKQYWFGALPVVQHNSNLFRGLQIIEYNMRQFVFQNKCLVIHSYFRM